MACTIGASAENLVWRKAKDGRLSVFAGRAIECGEIVERCYALPVKPSQFDGWTLQPWLYDCGLGGDEPLLLALGWGSLYNEVPPGRSQKSNLAWESEEIPDAAGMLRRYIVLSAVSRIVESEELCVARKCGRRGALRDMPGTILKVLKSWHGIRLQHTQPSSPSSPVIKEGVVPYPSVSDIEVRFSPLHGNGVFANRAFKKGELVEVAPSIYILNREFELDGLCTTLNDYWTAVDGHDELSQLDLGFGAIYNHSDEPNLARKTLKTLHCPLAQRLGSGFWATRDIEPGEELCHSYGKGYWEVRIAPGDKIFDDLEEEDTSSERSMSKGSANSNQESSVDSSDADSTCSSSSTDGSSLAA
eukprot:gnl/MRDRNA2_/MRDRNA2_20329_c0_seq1.p1 gnl/MRDRNA2_/MRDRNA2_20329_c0~~gnl/MRDRNA2_/MRDRNA2_20329_c0_seq1.p1  ORF type:complete len:360 (-),score=77.15 gnl/MRDRNA2_/MRDRNA2_20329_c0_seq1:167-1246(-)